VLRVEMCLTQPLGTLPAEEGAAYKNWRYFFTLFSLFSLCLPLHSVLLYAGKFLLWVFNVTLERTVSQAGLGF
jgi:hypothetical protein